MSEYPEVSVLDGAWSQTKPVVIIDARTARWYVDHGGLDVLVENALRALELTGQQVVLIEGQA